MQDLLAARFWIGMGSGILAALPSARAAAIELFAIGGVPIAHESGALTVRAVNGDGDHERLLFCIWNWSSQSTISCLFVPLPLIVIAPLLFRDEALPEHHLIGECIAVLGTALLLLPTLWLSFAESELNLVYTVVLLLESLVLLLLGIGVGVRIFILSGAGLIVVAALHALFLPSLGIPTPLALTILGLLLLAVSTGLSLARRRLRSVWSQWD